MRYLLMLSLALLFAVPVHATTVTFTVDPAMIGGLIGPSEFDFHSSQLNGTMLNGQAMSLDTIFANDVLMRFGLLDPSRLWVSLAFQTIANTAIDAAKDGWTVIIPNGSANWSSSVVSDKDRRFYIEVK